MRVLVTGAGGFIGRHLVADQLERGRDVVALDRDLSSVRHLAAAPLRLIEGDIRQHDVLAEAVDGVSVVFHLAAAHLSVATPAAEYREVNVDALRSLAAVSEVAGVRRFVHCSTVGVYGRLASVPADEETPCAPQFDYERTKLEGEGILMAAHRASGLPVVVLRPAWVYGPGCPRTDKLLRAVGSGRFVVTGRGRSLRHSVYIRDMLEAFELASTAEGAVGQVILIADDRAHTIRDLVDEVARIEGVRKPFSVPASMLYAAGLTAELVFGLLGREPPLSRRTLRFFSANTSFHTDRARRLLGFTARYSLVAGLEEVARLRHHGSFWSVPIPDTTTEC
jgi:nucleoside-diphosphate-sugar epimerase